MQIIPLILLILGLDYIAFQAIETVSSDWSTIARTILNTVYWFIPIAAFGFIVSGIRRDTNNPFDRSIFIKKQSFFILAYLAKFLIVIGLLLIAVKGIIFSITYSVFGTTNYEVGRTVLESWIAIGFGVIPAAVLLYGIFRNPYRYKVYKEKISIENLPKELEGLKIVQISDIHSGSFTKKEPVKKAIQLINQQQADLVFFTGDLVNTIAAEMDNFIDVFDKIKSKYGTFSILGNHDYGDYIRWENAFAKNQNFEKLKNTHKLLGWDLMLNENRLININGNQVAVIGVENYSASSRFPKYGKLDVAYQGTDNAKLKLLLSHDPSHWEHEVIEKYKDINVTFSGHTHGAQFGIEILGWIKWSPIKYVYKQWAGLYQKGSQFLYVNRGLGFLGYPGRVGILPEITVIELIQK